MTSIVRSSSRLAFPRVALFRTDLGVQRRSSASPDLAAEIPGRLEETSTLIASMTIEDAAAYPARTDLDWPSFATMGVDDGDTRAAQSAWWKVLTAVEQRVNGFDPGSGGFNEMFCSPVWRIYDRHWLRS